MKKERRWEEGEGRNQLREEDRQQEEGQRLHLVPFRVLFHVRFL